MSYQVLSAPAWAQREFEQVQLGDRRLNRRAVEVARAMASDPQGSIPRQSRSWSKTKGAYRLFNHPRVNFDSISQAHWRQTRLDCTAPVVLLIQDTTWLDYSRHPGNQGMGWHGPDHGSGLFLHSVLAVEPHAQGTGRVIGLADGKVWARTGEPANKTPASRNRRRYSADRESLRWSHAVNRIGASAAGTRWLHVGDRESDLFHLYEQTAQLPGVGFVIRVSKDRNADAGHDTPATASIQRRKSSSLKDLCRALPALGQNNLRIAAKPGRAARQARLNLGGGPVTIWSPQLQRTGRAFGCWVVRVWEPDPPAGVEPVEWMLLSSEPVSTLAQALRIAEYYSLRWLIEQYHQCLKSGCRVEERQLETAQGLEPLIGMLCVVAVRLLQLKNDARLTPQTPADQCVPGELVTTLARLLELRKKDLTIQRFTHEVAKLGGFLGRKGDGDPGWKTLWLGWRELNLIHLGRQLANAEKRCG